MDDKDAELGLGAESFAFGVVGDLGELFLDVELEFADGVAVSEGVSLGRLKGATAWERQYEGIGG